MTCIHCKNLIREGEDMSSCPYCKIKNTFGEDALREYKSCVDALCRQAHCFEPTPEIHEKALNHAMTFTDKNKLSGQIKRVVAPKDFFDQDSY